MNWSKSKAGIRFGMAMLLLHWLILGFSLAGGQDVAYGAGQESTRSIQRVVKDQSGKDVCLYKGSFALVIGVSRYTGGWPILESVPSEVEEIASALKAGGFEVVKVLDPDGEGLEKAFEDFIDKFGYEENNRLLFFFSGHGYSLQDGEKGFLVPVDAPDPRADLSGFLRKALDMTQIMAWSRKILAKHDLFLFDSCFSGAIFKTRNLPEIPPYISDITSKPVRQFISAGSAGQTVPAQSVFSPMFIRALRGDGDLDRDGYVTGTELGLFLRNQVTYYRTGQTPQYGKIRDPNLDEGDFVFVVDPKEKPGPVSPKPESNDDRPSDSDIPKSLQKAVGFFSGTGGKIDNEQARHLFLDADTAGNPLARMWLARLYFRGWCGFSRDKEKAVQLASEVIADVKAQAQTGNSQAQFLLASAYEEGLSLPQDNEKAMYWYDKAAESNDPLAMTNLGSMYRTNKGALHDTEKALILYKKAAALNTAAAMLNLGVMYQNGSGVPKDDEKAFYWYQKAAELNQPLAMNNIGLMYKNGKGVTRDFKKSFYWYQKAAELNDPTAMVHLGAMYQKGEGGTRSDEKALFWYQKAAESNVPTAMTNIGLMYRNGKGVTRDYKKALNWFEKAAELNEPTAMFNLGLIYHAGEGEAQDYNKALYWFQKAAELDNVFAMPHLADMYYFGQGVPRDYKKAFFWCHKAAESNSLHSMNNLGVMYNKGQGVPRNREKAKEWFRKAAEKGDEAARKNLARIGGEMGQVRVSVKKISESGKTRLFVQPDPEDASIAILNIGPKYQPGMELDPGRYHIKVTRQGKHTLKKWIEVQPGQEVRVDVTLW